MNKHDPQKIEAGLQQMQINTRLTALQTALEIMRTQNYANTVDHITMLAMAGEIENYILGELVDEAKKAIAEANKPVPVKPHIMRP